jgi:hypothetical protein
MSAGDALRALARFLDDCEAARSVDAVALAEAPASDAGALCADVEVVLASDPEHLAVRDASVDADGRLSLAVAAEAVVPAGRDVDVVDATARVRGDGALVATVAVSVPTDEARGSDRAPGRDTERGTGGRRDDEGTCADADADGEGDATASADDVATPSDEGEAGAAGARAGEPSDDRGVPAFRDRERLAAAYESCATFAEMREALDVEVTAETVRRYMIDAGVHQPASYDTDAGDDDVEGDGDATGDVDGDGGGAEATGDTAAGGTRAGDADGDGDADPDGDADADGPGGRARASAVGDGVGSGDDEGGTSRDGRGRTADAGDPPVVLADGVGLPDGVTPDALVDAVADATTTYEVERRLGLDRAETLATLRACDLLDLVAGRLGTATERDVAPGTVRDRLRRAAGTRSRRGSGAGNGAPRETGKDGR